MAHLRPIIAERRSPKTAFSAKEPPRTSAEGGQVEPVLGNIFVLISEI
jgi:hypothetical protein